MSNKFFEEMKDEFQMSMIGEMQFFLGLHITQNIYGICISQTKYLKELLKILAWKIANLQDHLQLLNASLLQMMKLKVSIKKIIVP